MKTTDKKSNVEELEHLLKNFLITQQEHQTFEHGWEACAALSQVLVGMSMHMGVEKEAFLDLQAMCWEATVKVGNSRELH